jgi:hypothetical protein
MEHGADPLWVRLMAGAFMMLKPSLLVRHHGVLAGNAELFRVNVPRCDGCAAQGKLIPLYVNTKLATVELKVMRSFADETRRLSANPG